MIIYIIHNDKIDLFRLTNDVSGKYIMTDYDSKFNKRNLLNVEGKDGKWFIYGNENIKIYFNNQYYDFIDLTLYSFYRLIYMENETIILYIAPSYDDTFSAFSVKENCEYIVGKASGCDFCYNALSSDKQLSISYVNGKFTFKNFDNKIPVFLNKFRSNEGVIENFDSIFLMGLRVVFCGNKIIVNNPNEKLIVNNPNEKLIVNSNDKFLENVDCYISPDYITDVRTFSDFYDDKDYYAKSPVFKPQIVPFKITISEPPAKAIRDKSSVLMNVVPTFLMTLSSVITTISSINQFKSGETTMEDLLSSLLLCLAMIVAGIIWPFVEKFYNNIIVFITNIKRTRNYKRYLLKKDKELIEKIKTQRMAYLVNNMDLESCKMVIEQRKPELFNRDIDGSDFLTIRLGIGDIEASVDFDYHKPDYVEIKDSLLNDVDKIIEKNKYIKDVPVSISLYEKRVIAFLLENKELFKKYVPGIILQLITFHSYYDLKLVVLTCSDDSSLSYLKDSNFCWNDNRTFRYYATDLDDAQKISTMLEREFKSREVSDKKSCNKPYYLIISDNIDIYRNLNIINDVFSSESSIGFGLLFFDTKISDIPSECSNFVNIGVEEGYVFQSNMNGGSKFSPDFISDFDIDIDYCSRLISNIPIKNNNPTQTTSLPDTISFLQMYGVGNVEQLNCDIRWDNSNTANSLSVPVGVDVNGNLISLDLHEKNHGPHGLIAGMTGSGKSEFIVTYILSLAINFRPDEVQFLLIDYKGGGLAGAFENRKEKIKLPHLVGTITNLDKSEMKRTLVSIKSELQRRQKKFNSAKELLNVGNIDIYKYQKLYREGALLEPLSHLFIICDEFAELKAQQPDFMDELVSAARIGRSLGIHLILATQKPSGVVDEQIWSNSRFKICCKVQTVDDSNEMIRKPDAAYLKESGRFYLQVGYDEYFILGQSAYSGMPYIPSETVVSKIDNDISFIDNTGEIYKTVSEKNDSLINREDMGEELINILKYIIGVADKKNFKYQQLWLDNVPSILYYDYVIKKYDIKSSLYLINPVIGEYDDPKNQKQGFVSLDFSKDGNTFICGASGSGKTTLFSDIIYSTVINHNSDEVNIYIVDLGAEKLTKFKKAPQVGDVLTIDDSDKISYLFYMLEDLRNTRQNYYSENGGDFNSDILQKKCPFPNILVFIYDIEAFKETFEDLYDDKFVPFTRSCSKFGIYFIVCSTSTSSLGFLAENNFPKKIVLNMVDQSDYTMFFETSLIPAKNPGRGLILLDDVYEFQVPILFNSPESDTMLENIFEQLNKFLKKKAKSVPVIPDIVNLDYVNEYLNSINKLPLGVNLVTAQISYYDFSSLFNLIASSRNSDGTKFMRTLIILMSKLTNKKIIVLNGVKDNELILDENIKYYDSSFKKVIPIIYDNVSKYNSLDTSDNEFLIFILGYNRINKILNKAQEDLEEGIYNLDELLVNAKYNKFFKFYVYDTGANIDEISDSEIANFIDSSNGIWVGRGFDGQNCFEAHEALNDNVRLSSDTVTLIKDGKLEYTKYVEFD